MCPTNRLYLPWLPLCYTVGPGQPSTSYIAVYICQMKESESETCSAVSNSLWPHGLYSPWNSPGQNTGVGSCFLLQVIFPIQGSNPGLPHFRWILYQLSHQGSPHMSITTLKNILYIHTHTHTHTHTNEREIKGKDNSLRKESQREEESLGWS